MPELPEVETIVRGLRPLVLGRAVSKVDVRRAEIVQDDAFLLQTLLVPGGFTALNRHGKYILWRTISGCGCIHLRMTGQLFLCDDSCPPDVHTHLIIHFSDGGQLRYRDVRRFGRWRRPGGAHRPVSW
jgi:formamidopyrimidine-DNA glycosylase